MTIYSDLSDSALRQMLVQGHEDSVRRGYSAIDKQAVERELAERQAKTKFVIFTNYGRSGMEVHGIFGSAEEAWADIHEHTPDQGFAVAPATDGVLEAVRDGGGSGLDLFWNDGKLDIKDD